MQFILISVTIIAALTIASGVYLLKSNSGGKQKVKKALRMNLASFIPLMVMALVLTVPQAVGAQEAVAGGLDRGLGFIAAAASTGFATLGTGYAVAVVGSAALGAVSEDQSVLGKTLIFVGMAEGIAIYGLIVSILIIGAL